MAHPLTSLPAPSRLGPLRAGPARALVEAAAGYAVLLAAAALCPPRGIVTPVSISFNLLAYFWLICWPAWRLSVVKTRRWWTRLGIGIPRACLVGLLLGGIAALLAAALWPPAFGALRRGLIAAPILGFPLARVPVVLMVSLKQRIVSRLRWQLMVSHAAVIVLTLTSMTAVGSLLATTFVLTQTRPGAQAMARDVAGILVTTGGQRGLGHRQDQATLTAIERGQIRLEGESPLASLIRRPVRPYRILLAGLDGHINASDHDVGNERQALPTRTFWLALQRPPGIWQRFLRSAAQGQQDAAFLTVRGISDLQAPQVAEAPILVSQRPVGMVLVESGGLNVTPVQFFQGTLAVFGVATILLILATSLPILFLSFLFAYLFARRLTHHLEDVSGVATAIASGNLKTRAPDSAKNEIGRLAEDINRMADHLETAMEGLRRARADAEEALRARQELVASISHELRTPLAILRAHLDTLLLTVHGSNGADAPTDDAPVPVHASTLEALQHETERLASLVDDLFTLSRGETGALQVQCEPVDVAAIVDDVARLMRPLVQQDRLLALSVEAQPGLPYALADADRLRQILSNLVRNAARHTPDGGIIVLSVAGDGPWIAISVADTGEGIPPEHLPHIFDRFYRVDNARTRGSGGTGLGLAIVRELVEMMGGRVTVESTVGEGSCFRVFLPVEPHTARPVPITGAGTIQQSTPRQS